MLVVEDEADVAEMIRYNLGKEGYDVRLAGNGADALRQVKEAKPDVILLDIMVPQLNGWEICRRLKQDRETVGIPVIMVTGRVEEGDKVLGFEMGADDYVTKPFSIRELLARVRAILRRTDGKKKRLARYQFSDLELDFEAYRATKGGQPLDLSPREFELLRYLIERKGETVSRDRLLEDVWGYESYPSTRTVDTHIAKLRAKIGDSGSEPRFILTIHGSGYKFVDPT